MATKQNGHISPLVVKVELELLDLELPELRVVLSARIELSLEIKEDSSILSC